MAKNTPEKIVPSVSIDLAEHEARIEKLPANETGNAGQVTLRISSRKKGGGSARPLTLSEEQLIELLYKASVSGVISNSFIGKLREKIEI
ncbi:MAG: hypothetical protein ABSA23_15920 [Anaerolineales bacterium]|jgi:hypothetical protein